MKKVFRGLSAVLTAAALTVGGVLVATPAQAYDTNDDLVQSWYSEFLGRSNPETDSGRWYWVNLLDSGWKRSDVAWALLHSGEYNGREIGSYYSAYLGRPADAGASYWIDGTTNRGMALEWVAQNILASPEYSQTWGDYNGNPTYAWYVDILGRGANEGERAYWGNRSRQVGALRAVREIWYSDEAVRLRIDDHYWSLLARPADIDGLNYWYWKEIESDINVKTLISSTQEYWDTRGRWGF